MEELVRLLGNVSDAYDDFILGTINYAKKDPSHIENLKGFLKSKTNLTSSDVISFIINQPDFHSFSATKEKEA